MERTSFWSRVGNWMRPALSQARRGNRSDLDLVDQSTDPADADLADSAEVEPPAKSATVAIRRRSRDDTLTRLEDGFGRVVNLCDSLNLHFTLQEERTAQIADSLKLVAGDMSKLATAVHDQGATLRSIAVHLETGNDRNEQMEKMFHHFSKMTEAQRQALAVVSQQVDSARETDERIGESLELFHQAFTTLGEACTESTTLLRQLRIEQAASDLRLSHVIEKQNQRFVLLFAVTLMVALSGIVGFVINVLGR